MKIREAALDEKGQALLEFALVTVFVIIPVMIAIIDGSILFYKWVTVNNAAREGSRAGAIYHYIGPNPPDAVGDLNEVLLLDEARAGAIKAAVDATIGPLVIIQADQDIEIRYDPAYRCVSGEPPECGNYYDVYRNGSLVTVAITHTHHPLVGLVIGMEELDLTAAATMRIEPGLPMP